jgi:hypothetical protein
MFHKICAPYRATSKLINYVPALAICNSLQQRCVLLAEVKIRPYICKMFDSETWPASVAPQRARSAQARLFNEGSCEMIAHVNLYERSHRGFALNGA